MTNIIHGAIATLQDTGPEIVTATTANLIGGTDVSSLRGALITIASAAGAWLLRRSPKLLRLVKQLFGRKS